MQIWQWRLKQGYTRQHLADKLQMNVAHLFYIERGIGKAEDISMGQLLALAELLSEDEVDMSLEELIQQFLESMT